MLSEYGLFLAKIVTVVVAIAVIVLLIVNATQRKRQRGELRVTNLSEQYQEMKDDLAAALMDGHQQKLWHKAQKKSISRRRKPPKQKRSWGHCDIGQTACMGDRFQRQYGCSRS